MDENALRRIGFTLLELLVVLAVIAVLTALIVPAVQKAREAANRSMCTNHLKQLALACHAFNDAKRTLPRGQFGGPYGDGVDSRAWSWLARLLPYIEHESVAKAGGIPDKTLKASGVAGSFIPLFFCPSDTALGKKVRLDAGNLAGFPVGMTNYKGVSGANWGDDLEGAGGANFTTDWRNKGTNGSYDGLSNGDGVFFRTDYRRRLSLNQIGDGASNTLLIGEDVPDKNEWCSWPYANNAYGTCAVPPNGRHSDGSEYPASDWRNTWSFRSRHAGGLQFALADGSVQFVTDRIMLPVYRALATVAGGEAVQVP